MDALKGCMIKNKKLGKYDIKNNTFNDEGNITIHILSLIK